MTIDELIGQLTEAKIQGHAGSEPVFIYDDCDRLNISMVDSDVTGCVDLNTAWRNRMENKELLEKFKSLAY